MQGDDLAGRLGVVRGYGDQRVAQVHNEGPDSPPVGRFEGTGGQGEVKGTLVSGHSVYKVDFKLKG